MRHSTSNYVNIFLLITCILSLLLVQCSKKQSSSTEHHTEKPSSEDINNNTFIEPRLWRLATSRFLDDWNNSTLETLSSVQEQYCSNKINTEANSCACINNRKHIISLQKDTSYNFLDSRYKFLRAYNRLASNDIETKTIYIIEIDNSGEIYTHKKIIFALSEIKTRCYIYEKYEGLSNEPHLKKVFITNNKTTLLLDSLWNSIDKPLQNKPLDYCESTFIYLTKVKDKIITRTPVYTHEGWFKILGRLNQTIN